MKKLRSFTVIELIVAMIISVIVIGLSYYGFAFINRQFVNYQSKANNSASYLLFKHAIEEDFRRADLIYSPNESLLSMSSFDTSQFQSSYSFEPDFILRKTSNLIDTIFIQNSFANVNYALGIPKLVRSYSQFVDIDDRRIKVTVEKFYSAEQLMTAENTNR